MNLWIGAALAAGYGAAAIAAYKAELRYRSAALRQFSVTHKLGSMWAQSESLLPTEIDLKEGRLGPLPRDCLHKPNRSITRWFIEADGTISYECSCRLNNIGAMSQFDVPLTKGANEFRILVLGGRETGSDFVNTSWPDHLRQFLASRPDLADKTISVVNFGTPLLTGFDYLPKIWNEAAKRYNPDFVIVAIAEYFFDMIPRPSLPPTYRGRRVKGFFEKYVSSRGENLWMVGFASGPKTLASRHSVAPIPFSAYLPSSLATSRDELARMQRMIVDDLLRQKMAWDVRPWRATARAGAHVDILKWLTLDPGPVLPPPTQNEKIEYALLHLRHLIADLPPYVLVTALRPSGLAQTPRETSIFEQLRARDARLEVVDVHTLLAVQADQYPTWFIPALGDMNDRGHIEYAKAIAPLVATQIARSVSGAP